MSDTVEAPVMDTAIVFETAQAFGVPVMVVADFYATYGRKVREGASVFWPWYQKQRSRFAAGALPFEPAYPHEVFPALPECFYPEP